MAGKPDDIIRGSTPPPWIGFSGHEAWERLFPRGERREWPAGAVLYRFGDRADELVLMRNGIAGIWALGMNGVQRNIGNLGPGSILGDAAFFHEGAYRHSIRCIVPSAGMAFSRRVIEAEVLGKDPVLSRYLFRNLAAKSYMMSTQLEVASFMSSGQQLAHFLWHLAQEQETDSLLYRSIAAVSLGRLEEMLGMHRVTVTKLMNVLKKKGVISVVPRIRIGNPEELERIFNGA